MFIDGNTLQRKLKTIRTDGELSPVPFGFQSWNRWDEGKFLIGSRGSTILIGGEPHHGKTAFTNELIMQLMEKHDFKVALLSSESGNIEKVFSIFYGLYIGKQYSKIRPDGKFNNYAMSDDEMHIAHEFINKRLYVFKQDNKKDNYQSIANFYKEVDVAQQTYGITFDSVVIDPIYDIEDFEPKADAVKRVLSYINQECEVNNRVDIVVNHVSETAKFIGKDGQRRKLRAMADEFYGGKNNQRKAMLQLLVERATPNEQPDNPDDYVPANLTNVHVLKAKPEGIAKMDIYPIFYDWKSRRYYEFYNEAYVFSDSSKIFKNNPQSKLPVPIVTTKEAFYDTDEIPF